MDGQLLLISMNQHHQATLHTLKFQLLQELRATPNQAQQLELLTELPQNFMRLCQMVSKLLTFQILELMKDNQLPMSLRLLQVELLISQREHTQHQMVEPLHMFMRLTALVRLQHTLFSQKLALNMFQLQFHTPLQEEQLSLNHMLLLQTDGRPLATPQKRTHQDNGLHMLRPTPHTVEPAPLLKPQRLQLQRMEELPLILIKPQSEEELLTSLTSFQLLPQELSLLMLMKRPR